MFDPFGLLAIRDLLKALLVTVRFGNRVPGYVHFKVSRQGENAMLFGNIHLPPPAVSDIKVRTLTYTINGGEQVVDTVDIAVNMSAEIGVEADDVIAGNLVDTDRAGNVGGARDFSLTAVDTIAPPVPGEVSFSATRQE